MNIHFFQEKYNTITDDYANFDKANNFSYMGGTELYMEFATLVESRITNDLMLMNNPDLCSKLGIDVLSLYAELEELVAIRQKISFGKAKEETKGR